MTRGVNEITKVLGDLLVEVSCIRRPYGGNAATGVRFPNAPLKRNEVSAARQPLVSQDE